MANRLKDKTILITAAGSGMGRASAVQCLKEGAKVIATDIDEPALKQLAEENPGITTHVLNVRDTNAINALAKQYPQLDCLFNVAGIVHHGSVMELSDEDWELSYDINVSSMVRTCRAFMPGMLERAKTTGSVSIVNMASMASSIKGFPNRTAYGATKAAVIGLSKAIAIDFVGKGVRCNTICPGTVDTPSLQGRIAQAPDPVQAKIDFIARQPIGRLATVDDITPIVIYLLSDDSQYVTGQNFSIDGGVTI